MKIIVIIEFCLVIILFIVVFVLKKMFTKIKTENTKLKLQLDKAQSDANYTRKLMELKDESYKNAKEKNNILDTGSKHERINAAGDVLCNN